jgi:hypothetical protein
VQAGRWDQAAAAGQTASADPTAQQDRSRWSRQDAPAAGTQADLWAPAGQQAGAGARPDEAPAAQHEPGTDGHGDAERTAQHESTGRQPSGEGTQDPATPGEPAGHSAEPGSPDAPTTATEWGPPGDSSKTQQVRSSDVAAWGAAAGGAAGATAAGSRPGSDQATSQFAVGDQQSSGQPAQQGWTPPDQQAGAAGWGHQPQQGAWAAPPAGTGGPAWGQQQPGQQQHQQGWTPPADPPRKGRGPLPWILAGVVVLILAAVAVLGFWRPGFFTTKVFDQTALQAGVTQVLTRDYGHQVSGVSCPAALEVTNGAKFTCDATVDGEKVKVPITVTSDDGNYEVGRV